MSSHLKGTRDKGYIFQPSYTQTKDCYEYEDFMGAWTFEMSAHPTSVKSRTGCIITFAKDWMHNHVCQLPHNMVIQCTK
jgi:hypothetical protein